MSEMSQNDLAHDFRSGWEERNESIVECSCGKTFIDPDYDAAYRRWQKHTKEQ